MRNGGESARRADRMAVVTHKKDAKLSFSAYQKFSASYLVHTPRAL
jgi:hypothetical protein